MVCHMVPCLECLIIMFLIYVDFPISEPNSESHCMPRVLFCLIVFKDSYRLFLMRRRINHKIPRN